MKKKLDKTGLAGETDFPITSQNRIPLLQNGTFDFVRCWFYHQQRRTPKTGGFITDTIFVVGTRLLTKKGGDIKDFADLKAKP